MIMMMIAMMMMSDDSDECLSMYTMALPLVYTQGKCQQNFYLSPLTPPPPPYHHHHHYHYHYRYIQEHPTRDPKAWVLGGGWRDDWFAHRIPRRQQLDDIFGKVTPVFLRRWDMHACW